MYIFPNSLKESHIKLWQQAKSQKEPESTNSNEHVLVKGICFGELQLSSSDAESH